VSTTVPTTPHGADRCALDWCQQPAGHAPENHVRLVDLVEPTPFNSTVEAVLVTIEAGAGEVDPLPVVTLVATANRSAARFGWTGARP
jgi:hypothetical protein